MRERNTKRMIELAQSGEGQVAKIVKGCIEVGIVVPSILRKALEGAGCKITYHTGPGEDAPEGDHPNGAWVLVRGPVEVSPGVVENHVVARAYSADKAEALLHAVYGWLKEEAGVTDDSIIKV